VVTGVSVGGERANDENERVLRNVEKYYYLIECSKERMKESGRRNASRWRGIDARCERSAETGWAGAAMVPSRR
jgi:hypothetical protein